MAKSSKTPPVPDYTSLANLQGVNAKAAWENQLRANRPNQTNQFGASTWSQDPIGNWTQNTQLNGPQQDIFNQQQSNQQGIADKSGQMINDFDTSQIDFSGAPKMGEVGGFNQQATDLYNQLAQPGLDRQVNSQRARAAAMGIPEFGSRAGDNMNQQLGDMTSRSGMMGAQAGINQGNTMFGQQKELHQQGVSDILGKRQANLGNLTGLMGIGKEMGTPKFDSFTPAGAYQTPDLMGAASKGYDASLNTTNAGNADKANTMKTVGTIASIAATVY